MKKLFFTLFRCCYLLLTALLCLPANASSATHYGSLVVGVARERVNGIIAGSVQLINGSALGMSTHGSTILSQGKGGLAGEAQSGDFFGSQLATGDFNNDGFPDLAIGVPSKKVSIYPAAGVVHIIYGAAGGLTTANNHIIRQGMNGFAGHPLGDEWFGSALAAGDFNGDGFADLAVAAEKEDVGLAEDAGKLYIIYGSQNGLTSLNNQVIQQGRAGFVEFADEGDNFGSALATGDFNNDGYWDLAVGVSGEIINRHSNAGAVHIIYGSGNGLTSAGNRIWSQDSASIIGQAGQNFRFGNTLTSGDYNNDGFSDIVVGVVGEIVAGHVDAGAINILFGSENGITDAGNQHFNQQSIGIYGAAAAYNRFGFSLASGDFNNDGFSDIVVGEPGQNIEGIINAGHVAIIYGANNGLTTLNSRIFSQKTHGIIGIAEINDFFGTTVTTGDFNRDGFFDLAVGTFYDDLNDITDSGAVNIFYGSANGLTNTGEQYITQNSGIVGTAQNDDFFGYSLVYLPNYIFFSWPMFLPATTKIQTP